jgi:hypothetical protein
MDLVYPIDSQKVNLGLAYYCQSQLEIPLPILQNYFPNKNLQVKALLIYNLPKVTISLVVVKATHCFHTRKPNDDGIQLGQRNIPSEAWVNAMYMQFNQAILDGKQSVEDPQYPGSYLPLWSIGFWRKMQAVVAAQNDWRHATEWLKNEAHSTSPQLRETAHRYAESLRWNEQANISRAGTYTSTHSFTAFLSNNVMMATDHMNMMFSYLSDRAECDEVTDRFIVIENLCFMHQIEKAKTPNHWDSPSSSFLKRLKEWILDKKVLAMVFPVFLADMKHWLTC